VTEYRMFVSSGAIVAGTYRISSSGKRMSARHFQRMTIPAMNRPRNVSDAAVAAV